MAERRRRVGRVQADVAAREVAHAAVLTPAWQHARRVAVYAALPDELPTRALVALAEKAGLPMLWPRIDDERLVFVGCAEKDLVPGRFGIASPPRHLSPVVLDASDVLIVPGVAFDANGNRLGRGGGYYDRVLAALGEEARSIGIGYDFQRVEQVPTAPHDVPVNFVVTEAGTTQRRAR